MSEGKSSLKGAPDSVALLLFFLFWYAGNMQYNKYNSSSLNAVGGKNGGLTMTVATMQLGVCAVYGLLMWIVGLNPAKLFGLQMPDRQKIPQVTSGDLIKSIPLAFCAAGAHAATVFALGGDPLFGQIGKLSTRLGAVRRGPLECLTSSSPSSQVCRARSRCDCWHHRLLEGSILCQGLLSPYHSGWSCFCKFEEGR